MPSHLAKAVIPKSSTGPRPRIFAASVGWAFGPMRAHRCARRSALQHPSPASTTPIDPVDDLAARIAVKAREVAAAPDYLAAHAAALPRRQRYVPAASGRPVFAPGLGAAARNADCQTSRFLLCRQPRQIHHEGDGP